MLLTVTNLSSTAAVSVGYPVNQSIAASGSVTVGVSLDDLLFRREKGDPAYKAFNDQVKRGDISFSWAADANESGLIPMDLLLGRSRIIKTGRIVAAGAGDEVVAFTEAMPSTDYSVSLTFEDSGGGATLQTAYVKQSTVAVGGFTATVSAAGTFHWIAILDG